jgi:hypothetical protein
MECAYLYTNSEIMEISKDDAVVFNKNGYLTDEIHHPEGSDKIRFGVRGLYLVSFVIHAINESIFAIIVNERIVSSSIAQNTIGNKLIGQSIIQIEEGDCLQVRNCSGKDVVLNCFAGGSQRNVRVSLIVEQVE